MSGSAPPSAVWPVMSRSRRSRAASGIEWTTERMSWAVSRYPRPSRSPASMRDTPRDQLNVMCVW